MNRIGVVIMVAGLLLISCASARPDEPIILKNKAVELRLNRSDMSWVAIDRRNGTQWRSFPADKRLKITGARKTSPLSAVVTARTDDQTNLNISFSLSPTAAEFKVTTRAKGESPLTDRLNTVPAIAAPGPDMELVVPIGEGMLYPTNDPGLRPLTLDLSAGNDLTMPWFGVWNRRTGAAIMCMVTESREQCLGELSYRDGRAGTMTLFWIPRKGRWMSGRATAAFFLADKGGYVTLAKRYRARIMPTFVTLKSKQSRLPQLARMLGAPSLWFIAWDSSQAERDAGLKWFHDHGIDHMLCSALDPDPRPSQSIAAANAMGYITARYDLYVHVWDPKDAGRPGVPKQSFGYPDDIIRTREGDLQRGWVVHTSDGDVPGYMLCSTQQVKWASRRIPPDLSARAYGARFIDVTGGIGALECWSKSHGQSRSEDQQHKRELLKYVTDLGLVCGTETAGDWAAPVICYTEGIMSPVPYRDPQAGYLPANDKPLPDTLKYQVNPAVRVPLWELVYHDSVVAYWYWGDATNTYPSVWDLRNCFNALYATPPLFMIARKSIYESQRERMVETYKSLEPVFESAGWNEMIDHRFLSPDRKLQMTRFANGGDVIVNFSETSRMWQGRSVPARAWICSTARPRSH